MTDRHNVRWTADEDRLLLTMCREGHSWETITVTLARSRASCSTRMVNLRSVLGDRDADEIQALQDLLCGMAPKRPCVWS